MISEVNNIYTTNSLLKKIAFQPEDKKSRQFEQAIYSLINDIASTQLGRKFLKALNSDLKDRTLVLIESNKWEAYTSIKYETAQIQINLSESVQILTEDTEGKWHLTSQSPAQSLMHELIHIFQNVQQEKEIKRKYKTLRERIFAIEEESLVKSFRWTNQHEQRVIEGRYLKDYSVNKLRIERGEQKRLTHFGIHPNTPKVLKSLTFGADGDIEKCNLSNININELIYGLLSYPIGKEYSHIQLSSQDLHFIDLLTQHKIKTLTYMISHINKEGREEALRGIQNIEKSMEENDPSWMYCLYGYNTSDGMKKEAKKLVQAAISLLNNADKN